ncbi:MAG TPA: peptidylprolyl isomerase [Pirellulales bacterium]|jgi:parvulin-like peptidyl-prolyl isomerase|nr:peptidylprolyl isomerase [Pirellulales bacterium]
MGQKDLDRQRRQARWTRVKWIVAGLLMITFCVAVRMGMGTWSAKAAAPAKTVKKSSAPAEAPSADGPPNKPQIVAIVNDEKISRNDLAQEALVHYGEEVLEMLMNKHLILDACERHGISVSQEEVAAEIDRMAERFGVATDQWLKMLREERNISAQQYARDIVWPSIALRKLAADRIEPTEDDIKQAYETQYGPQVQVRLIVCNTLEKARKVHEMAVAAPEDFGNLAKEYSDDTNSASAKGLIQPIRRHMGDPNLERIAFNLQQGEVSEIVTVGADYAMLRCEKHLAARDVDPAKVNALLADACRDKKLRLASGELFQQLKTEAQIEDVFHDAALQQKYPGIAMIINGKRITMLELADECIERHGKQTLEGTINRRLLDQACKRQQIEITNQEIDEEIAHAAATMGRFKPDGSPDVETWLKEVVEEQKTTVERYRYDAIWPSAALKRLTANKVDVTAEDLKRGYDANWGMCKRCRAIVFHDTQLRKAQEVWDMARTRLSLEHFGNLAEEYSVEAGSRVLRGEIPPIPLHSGQPTLEKEAFALQPGELSGVFMVGDKWVILYCEGDLDRTAQAPSFEEVRSQIYDDVFEKKQRVAMAKEFTTLQELAQVDNFLTGQSRSPTKGQSIDSLTARAGDQAAGPAARTSAAPAATQRR